MESFARWRGWKGWCLCSIPWEAGKKVWPLCLGADSWASCTVKQSSDEVQHRSGENQICVMRREAGNQVVCVFQKTCADYGANDRLGNWEYKGCSSWENEILMGERKKAGGKKGRESLHNYWDHHGVQQMVLLVGLCHILTEWGFVLPAVFSFNWKATYHHVLHKKMACYQENILSYGFYLSHLSCHVCLMHRLAPQK